MNTATSRAFAALILTLTSAGCSHQRGVDPNTWTCADLVQPVIEMSKDKEAKLLEITNVAQSSMTPGQSIECSGIAEWSEGGGNGVGFGAHVSDGGQIILEYRRLGGTY